VGRFLNAVNITGRFFLDRDHRLRVAVVGREIAAYLDGTLVVQGTLSEDAFLQLRSTRAGLSRDEPAQGKPLIMDFWARAAEMTK